MGTRDDSRSPRSRRGGGERGQRGGRPLVALIAGLVLLAGATTAEAVQPVGTPTSSPTSTDSTAGTVRTAQARGYEGGATGDGPADDAECEGYARRLNVLVSQAAFWYRHNSPNTGDALVQGAEAVEDEATDRGCFIMNDAPV